MICIYVTVVVLKIDTLLKGGNIRKYLFQKTFRITSPMGIALNSSVIFLPEDYLRIEKILQRSR